MSLRISLRTRFTFSVAILLTFLVSLIIFVIQKREVATIINESRNQGVLIAKNIAYVNLQPLLFWDQEELKRRTDEQVDRKLLYVIFYSR